MPNKNENSVKISADELLNELEAVGNTGWDDLNTIANECSVLALSPHAVLPMIKDPAKLALVKDMPRLEELSKILVERVTKYNDQLNAIKEKHAGKTGGNTSPDDLMVCLGIGEEYNNWIQLYQLNVLLVVNEISALFTPDESYLEETANEQPEQTES